ncbi:MAG: cysteine--tRNA ligase, partial [Athalassotoga sp.]
MKIYNTLSGQKEEFVPLNPNAVKMYVCGPTVYNLIHVGNARPAVVFDAFRRYLEYRGYSVIYVQNFTDVDDKIIKAANIEGVDPKVIGDRYVAEYFKDACELGIQPATYHPRTTNFIEQIKEFVLELEKKHFAYQRSSDVYFDVSAFPSYGALSHRNPSDMRSGARVEINENKDDPLDFVLWKGSKAGEPKWESPWGDGRPGWHIECSSMSKTLLGDAFDIHAGGNDLIFPHHEDERAQTEALTGKKWVNYWMHNGMISVKDEKMSKSIGNIFTVR